VPPPAALDVTVNGAGAAGSEGRRQMEFVWQFCLARPESSRN
jgi:hypothetical protein